MRNPWKRAATLAFGALWAWVWLLWAQSVTITVTGVNNSLSVTAAAIQAGTLAATRAFDVSIDATANFSVSAQLDSILVNGMSSSIPAAALSATANASGAAGTTDVTINPFSGFGAAQDISGAFSGLAGASNETSRLDVQLNLAQLGNRAQGDTLSFNLTFIVTEQP